MLTGHNICQTGITMNVNRYHNLATFMNFSCTAHNSTSLPELACILGLRDTYCKSPTFAGSLLVQSSTDVSYSYELV